MHRFMNLMHQDYFNDDKGLKNIDEVLAPMDDDDEEIDDEMEDVENNANYHTNFNTNPEQEVHDVLEEQLPELIPDEEFNGGINYTINEHQPPIDIIIQYKNSTRHNNHVNTPPVLNDKLSRELKIRQILQPRGNDDIIRY
jgi:hypothetical protein